MQRAQAMEAQADLIDAQEAFKASKKDSDKLRSQAKIMIAEERLKGSLVTIEDQRRMLKAYNEVRLELQDQVRAEYPGGIEEAEPDNWKAVATYRVALSNVGYSQNLPHIPLKIEDKAQLGLDLKRLDLMAWQLVRDPKELEKLLPTPTEGVTDGQGLLARIRDGRPTH